MKIMVFDVPAQSGGALTILKQYYEKAVKDVENNWVFVISTPELKQTTNVKVLNFPWVKKSWFHRLYFDRLVSSKLVEEYKIDEILSLQNLVVPGIDIKQTLYLHQPLPFVEKRYKINENFKFWIYQNIIAKMIFKSIRKADKVIVQTQWMRDACLEKLKIASNKFELNKPNVNIKVKEYYKHENEDNKLFFYPASALEYKNHRIIIQAVSKLANVGYRNFEVILTLYGNENNNIREMYERVKLEKLPIKFIGTISIDEVYKYYSKSILIFSSYIETFGLPMLEARVHESPIIASDCAFSHEILDGYEKAAFFDPFDVNALYLEMQMKVGEL